MESENPKQFAVVLPAGGARAAYQVGVLSYLSEAFPQFQPKIFCGISAGSINTSFLAQGEPFHVAAPKLRELWSQLEFNQVIKTQFPTLARMLSRWMYDLFLSKVSRKLLLKSLLDTSPLAGTLLEHIHFWKIAKAIREGSVSGVSVTATNYHNGQCTIFYDSHKPLVPWLRQDRIAVRAAIRVRHILASCSIPILFEPIRIGNFLYGDGSLRYNFPFSPAVHLGATHVLAVSIRCPTPTNALGFRPANVGMGFIAGAVLNSIFLDSLEPDFEQVLRLNRVGNSPLVKKVNPLMIRPSVDLGSLAKEYLSEVPFHFRQLLRSTAKPEEMGDLLSYLMFSPGYIGSLIELGRKDAKDQATNMQSFLDS